MKAMKTILAALLTLSFAMPAMATKGLKGDKGKTTESRDEVRMKKKVLKGQELFTLTTSQVRVSAGRKSIVKSLNNLERGSTIRDNMATLMKSLRDGMLSLTSSELEALAALVQGYIGVTTTRSAEGKKTASEIESIVTDRIRNSEENANDIIEGLIRDGKITQEDVQYLAMHRAVERAETFLTSQKDNSFSELLLDAVASGRVTLESFSKAFAARIRDMAGCE